MPDTVVAAPPRPLRIGPAAPATRFLLRGDADALGAAFGMSLPRLACTAATDGPRTALWLGPDEWLLLVPRGTDFPLWEGEAGAAFDVTHRQIGIALVGERAADVLSAACPLDVGALTDGFCSRTVLGKAEITIWRQGRTSFHLEVWRSFAPYVTALLDEKAR